jgi:hypothetical protein
MVLRLEYAQAHTPTSRAAGMFLFFRFFSSILMFILGSVSHSTLQNSDGSNGSMSHISFFSCHAVSRVVTPLTAMQCDKGI